MSQLRKGDYLRRVVKRGASDIAQDDNHNFYVELTLDCGHKIIRTTSRSQGSLKVCEQCQQLEDELPW